MRTKTYGADAVYFDLQDFKLKICALDFMLYMYATFANLQILRVFNDSKKNVIVFVRT